MDAYELLRKQAAAKLDQTIQAARTEYRATCDKINSLRRELGDEPEPGLRVHKTAIDAVREYMPQDRPFSNREIHEIDERSLQEPGPPQGHASHLPLLLQLVQGA